MSTITLNPCPFCDGGAELTEYEYVDATEWRARVTCCACGAQSEEGRAKNNKGCFDAANGLHRQRAADLWNRRPALAATGTPQGAKTFEQWATEKGLIATSHGIKSVSSMCSLAEAAWNGALASQGAAPASECDSPKLCAVNKGCAGQYGTKQVCSTPAPGAAPTGAGDAAMGNITAERAAFFLHRFKLEEKMLGPNEQAALEFAIAALAAPQQPAEAALAALAALADDHWYWVRYEGLGRTYTACALYKGNVDCFYSYEFSGIPARKVVALSALVAPAGACTTGLAENGGAA